MSRPKKILLVDDDRDFLESNRIMLEACGYEIQTAENGKEAIAAAVKMIPDLMILDVMMTYDTEGLDVAREVRTHPELNAMKILMVSGIAHLKKLEKMPKPDEQWLPVDRVLEKPIEPSTLMAELEKLLADKTQAERS